MVTPRVFPKEKENPVLDDVSMDGSSGGAKQVKKITAHENEFDNKAFTKDNGDVHVDVGIGDEDDAL